MYFIIDCEDSDEGAALRPVHRPAHLQHLERVRARILTAGPKLNAQGNPCGSLLVIDFTDSAAAQAFASPRPLRPSRRLRQSHRDALSPDLPE